MTDQFFALYGKRLGNRLSSTAVGGDSDRCLRVYSLGMGALILLIVLGVLLLAGVTQEQARD